MLSEISLAIPNDFITSRTFLAKNTGKQNKSSHSIPTVQQQSFKTKGHVLLRIHWSHN